ncbi:hypothetical protein MRX96_057567 [Rhipicephalus microplus]
MEEGPVKFRILFAAARRKRLRPLLTLGAWKWSGVMAAAAVTSGPRTKWRKPEFRFPRCRRMVYLAHSPTSLGVDRMSGATDHHYVESR